MFIIKLEEITDKALYAIYTTPPINKDAKNGFTNILLKSGLLFNERYRTVVTIKQFVK